MTKKKTKKMENNFLLSDEDVDNIKFAYRGIIEESKKIGKEKNVSEDMIDYIIYSNVKKNVEELIEKIKIELNLTKKDSRELKNIVFSIISEEDKKRKLEEKEE